MKKMKWLGLFLAVGFLACNSGNQQSNPADSTMPATDTTHQMTMDTTASIAPMPTVPDGANVFFVNLKDGQEVTSPFKVDMGVKGIAIQPAGEINQGFGHHHLLIDIGDSIPMGTVIPTDAQHMHFGKGQTTTEVTLSPGKHVLTLQFADGMHRSYGSKLAATIHITVK